MWDVGVANCLNRKQTDGFNNNMIRLNVKMISLSIQGLKKTMKQNHYHTKPNVFDNKTASSVLKASSIYISN